MSRSLARITALWFAFVCAPSTLQAQDFDDPAVQSVEDLDGGAKRVVVRGGATWAVRVGSGETVEKLLVDIDRPGANFRLNANGNGWTVRNIGVPRGGHQYPDGTVVRRYERADRGRGRSRRRRSRHVRRGRSRRRRHRFVLRQSGR